MSLGPQHRRMTGKGALTRHFHFFSLIRVYLLNCVGHSAFQDIWKLLQETQSSIDIKLALLVVKSLIVLSISDAKIFLRSNELSKHIVQMLRERENFYFLEKKSHFDQVLPKIKKANKQKSVELCEVLEENFTLKSMKITYFG